MTEKPMRILFVDDDIGVHKSYEQVFSSKKEDTSESRINFLENEIFGLEKKADSLKSKYIVSSAYQGEDAVKLVRDSVKHDKPFTLAVVDIRMPPGIDGVETVKRIWEIDKDIQVIFCTAFSDSSLDLIIDEVKCIESFLFLRKPFDVNEIVQSANCLCEKWMATKKSRDNGALANVNEKISKLENELNKAIEEKRQLLNRICDLEKLIQ